jgi:hypothetical protein
MNVSWRDGPTAIAGRRAGAAHAATEAGLRAVWADDHRLRSAPASRPGEPVLLTRVAAAGQLAAA